MELKPCPFCGGEAHCVEHQRVSVVACRSCKARFGPYLDVLPGTLENGWNERVFDVVFCCECDHYNTEAQTCGFWPDQGFRDPYHYCGEGVRREEEPA